MPKHVVFWLHVIQEYQYHHSWFVFNWRLESWFTGHYCQGSWVVVVLMYLLLLSKSTYVCRILRSSRKLSCTRLRYFHEIIPFLFHQKNKTDQKFSVLVRDLSKNRVLSIRYYQFCCLWTVSTRKPGYVLGPYDSSNKWLFQTMFLKINYIHRFCI